MNNPANVPLVLIGMMGSGKTTCGRILAQLLGRQFIDLDEQVERCSQMTISRLLTTRGETGLREFETLALRQALKHRHSVIASGGGVILRCQNRRLLTDSGFVIFLRTSVTELARRLATEQKVRPLLDGSRAVVDQLVLLANQRNALYLAVSDLIVSTDTRSTAATAAVIQQKLEECVV
ncbi:MAG: shikimate kinase [Candidatus Delongbacteria bacterium]|nr:shikimate kinase [Candidatus Delongbacteria bacterium]